MDRAIPVLEWIAFFGVFVALLARIFWDANREKEAKSWPSTEATIESAEMGTVRYRKSSALYPCFAFSYVVGGEYYSGRFSLLGCNDRSAALIREMIDKKFTVQYDPAKPDSYAIPNCMVEGCAIGPAPN